MKHGKMIKDYIGVTAGSLITALGLVIFLIPNQIAAGGLSGLATILYYLFRFPVGVTMLVINIPLLLLCIKELGMKFGAKSIYGTLIISIFVDLVTILIPQPWTQDAILASLYGGVLCGVGSGIVFRSGGTTGGTDLAAALIHKFAKISLGYGILIVDALVILLAGIVFSIELALYALASVYVTSKIIDVVQEGVSHTKAALIISEEYQRITQELLAQMNRGVTSFQSKGAYTKKEREVLLCVVSQSEVSTLKSIVYHIDPKAFVIVSQVHEVLGEGFKVQPVEKS
ncbi:YitT family protein [Dehalobacterium formicoaceticum]|uniref:YitT family protein n=1 Tax=Dehalobacterium formicoaceticum TaxID=51515 RepID=A0ABT1Y3E3_9FIRM|nr:YitT family protein [Dehalobacterium formicoaceticum]MCR6545384.1 YitT family protein [Dehalobacterium formicoaceticum]